MTRITATTAAVMLALGLAGAAKADQGGDALSWQPMTTADLAEYSGGTDTFDASKVFQGNVSETGSANFDNQINNGAGARMENGAISDTQLSGNNGITTAMQNTGNLVNMNYSMNVNVYLK